MRAKRAISSTPSPRLRHGLSVSDEPSDYLLAIKRAIIGSESD